MISREIEFHAPTELAAALDLLAQREDGGLDVLGQAGPRRDDSRKVAVRWL